MRKTSELIAAMISIVLATPIVVPAETFTAPTVLHAAIVRQTGPNCRDRDKLKTAPWLFLRDHWPYLAEALQRSYRSATRSAQFPYRLAAEFRAGVLRPRTALQRFLLSFEGNTFSTDEAPWHQAK